MDIIKATIFLIFLGFLVYQGLSPSARFASWRMFTKSPRAFYNLKSKEKELKIWEALPHSNLAVNLNAVFLIIAFLKEKYPDLSGTITVVEFPVIFKVRIKECDILNVRRRYVRRFK